MLYKAEQAWMEKREKGSKLLNDLQPIGRDMRQSMCQLFASINVRILDASSDLNLPLFYASVPRRSERKWACDSLVDHIVSMRSNKL